MVNAHDERAREGSFSLHGIQCGIARISMVPSTGSPSQPRVSMSLSAPHRLVVAHVLIDGQRDACPGASVDAFLGLAKTHGERLLGQDAANVIFVLGRLENERGLRVRRHGYVEHFHRFVV